MERRSFVRLCASAGAAVGAPDVLARTRQGMRAYEPALLVDADGAPVRSSRLPVGQCYVFHYPYITTPCFLVDLGQATRPVGTLEIEGGTTYKWPGGVGAGRSVVAFAAICAHKMTHPARAVSFINYRHDEVRFVDSGKRQTRRGGVIYCCSERSVYDPARGARVIGGPAPQPLAAIALKHDAGNDNLLAVGTFGGEMYEKFFERFGFRLALEFETSDIRRQVGERSVLVPVEEYSRTRIRCG